MAGKYKMLRSVVLLLSLVNLARPQTFADITRNDCGFLQGLDENLSCADTSADIGDPCLEFADLCDGTEQCNFGEDEGDPLILNALECNFANPAASTYNCASGSTQGSVPINQLCDGVNNCGNTPSSDEVNALCDNKCLLPYYGGCPSRTRPCLTSAFTVSCGDGCLDGFVEDDPPGADCLPLINFQITAATAQVSVTEGDPGDVPTTFDVCIFASSIGDPSFSVSVPISAISFDFSFVSPASLTLDFSQQTFAPLTFTAAAPEACVTFQVTNDFTSEATEFFGVVFNPVGVNFNVIDSDTAQVTIFDNDDAIVEFSAATYTGIEQTQQLVATVVISNNVPITADVTVTCTAFGLITSVFQEDFATLTADFSTIGVAATISVGDSDTQCVIPLVDDDFIENTEIFGISLTITSAGATLGVQSVATGFIQINDDPTFGFAVPELTEVEANVFLPYQIVITNGVGFDPANPVVRQVRIDSQNGLAFGGADYAIISNRILDISADPFTDSFQLLDDDDNEQKEDFDLLLSTTGLANSNTDPTQDVLTVIICDDDLIELAFADFPSVDTEEVLPNGQNVQICVDLISGVLTSPLVVTLTPSSGLGVNGAQAGLDFNGGAVQVTFPTGAAPGSAAGQQCAFIFIIDDNEVENTESFTVLGEGGDFGLQSTITVFIADNDDAVFDFASDNVGFPENGGPGVLVIQLVSNVQLTSAVTIQCFTIAGGTALPNGVDFTQATQNLVFPMDSTLGTSQNFEVVFNNELLVEADEDIMVQCQILNGVAEFSNGGQVDQASIVIENDDVLVIGFQDPEFHMVEAADQMVCLTVVSGMLDTGITVTVGISTQQGFGQIISPTFGPAQPATQVVDYDPIPNPTVVQFPTANPCVEIGIVDDDQDEPKEYFIAIAAVTGGPAVINDNNVNVLICDDDLLVVQFSMLTYIVSEGGPSIEVCVDLTFGVVGSAPLPIRIQSVDSGVSSGCDGNAQLGVDYNEIDATVFFPAGTEAGDNVNDQQCFTVSAGVFNADIINDIIVELTESVQLMASSTNIDVEFTQAGGNSATLQITDNDVASVSVSVIPPSFDEDVGDVQACIQVPQGGQNELGCPVDVRLFTEDDTATGTDTTNDPADYCSLDEVITINPGDEGVMICRDIGIVNDDLCEATETFDVAAESVGGGTTIINSPAVATIFDDDVASIAASDTTFSFPENIGMIMIPIILTGQKAPGRSCVVGVSTMDGTAVSIGMNPDYMDGTQSLTFDDTIIFNQAEIEINDDGICEGNEEFEVMLTIISGACEIAAGGSPITVIIEDDEIGGGGDDPHFSIVLPSGKLLCFTVQGEHGFSFNLISNKKMTMNAKFVPDSRRSEVTWMGSMGIIVRDNTYKQSNATALRFEAREKKVYIGDKVALEAKNIEKLTFKNGKLTISEATPTESFKYPSIYVDLQDVEITFTMKFMNEHLDIFWHRTGGKIPDSHGLIGQFFRTGVTIDEVRKILIMPNKEPVPVMRRPVWSFMERETVDDQLCWTAMNPGYQGEGLIDGTYYDYLVDDVMTSEYQFTKKQ